MPISRRSVILGLSATLGGCASNQSSSIDGTHLPFGLHYATMYSAIDTESHPVEAVDLTKINSDFLRREVSYRTPHQPGTIVVDPNDRYAYLVMERDRALRYGVGVGREAAFNFQGTATILRKAEWPRWTPTPDMIRREPERYARYAGGLEGGANNPLGARALYLYKDGHDTLYRLHGTNEPWTIGTTVSSGCVRLLNQDIIDLYRRVPIGTKVVVGAVMAAQV